MKRKIVIIGGVAGGATAAARLRRLNEEDEIVIFEKGEYISFANCGLPYHIGGVIQERDNLLLETVGGMAKKFNIGIKNFSEVVKINRGKEDHHSETRIDRRYDGRKLRQVDHLDRREADQTGHRQASRTRRTSSHCATSRIWTRSKPTSLSTK